MQDNNNKTKDNLFHILHGSVNKERQIAVVEIKLICYTNRRIIKTQKVNFTLHYWYIPKLAPLSLK